MRVGVHVCVFVCASVRVQLNVCVSDACWWFLYLPMLFILKQPTCLGIISAIKKKFHVFPFSSPSLIIRYGRRRVVIRKGHLGYAFYFIFAGAVCVTLDEDEESAFVKKEVTILKKGACFGVRITQEGGFKMLWENAS